MRTGYYDFATRTVY